MTRFTSGTNSCGSAAGTTNCQRFSSAGKKKRAWRAGPRSKPCSRSSTQMKAGCWWATRNCNRLPINCPSTARRRDGNHDLVWRRRLLHSPVDKFPNRQDNKNNDERRDPVTQRHLFGKGVDPLRQCEIELGQAAFAVSRKDQSHFIV